MSFCTKLAILFTVGTLLNVATAATPSPFPRGCEINGFGFKENYLVLNERNQQSFFLIQNHSAKPVELEHYETKDVFMSPKLHSKLEALNWSAFASDEENMYFKCYTQENDTITVLNCRDVLEVCQYPRVKFALSNMGNYWVSTNKEQGQVIKDAVAKGILLRW